MHDELSCGSGIRSRRRDDMFMLWKDLLTKVK